MEWNYTNPAPKPKCFPASSPEHLQFQHLVLPPDEQSIICPLFFLSFFFSNLSHFQSLFLSHMQLKGDELWRHDYISLAGIKGNFLSSITLKGIFFTFQFKPGDINQQIPAAMPKGFYTHLKAF